MKLHEISAPRHKDTKRLGRGIGSGSGKTSGRGTKGQNSRTGGGVKIGFEGGQTKLSRRLPKKRGFTARNHTTYQVVTTDTLEKLGLAKVDKIVLDNGGYIDADRPVKLLLGSDTLKLKVNLTVDAASATALKAVQKAGGEVTLLAKPRVKIEKSVAKTDAKPVKKATDQTAPKAKPNKTENVKTTKK